MDSNLQQIKTLADIVDSQLTKDAETIVNQAAQIQDLQAQIDTLKNPPPGITFSNLERLSTWIQPGTVGNTGGGDANAAKIGIMTPGAPAIFKTTATKPYNNPYWYLKLAPIVPDVMKATKFSYSLSWQFPSAADLAVCQAVEFELQQHIDTEIYNMAWQMPLKERLKWCTFDYSSKQWIPTAIPVDTALLQPGAWLNVTAEYVRDASAKTLTHTAITINGIKTVVNVKRPCSISSNSVKSMNAAFQLDTDHTPTNYQVKAQNFNVVAS